MVSVLYFALIIDRLRRKKAIPGSGEDKINTKPDENYYIARIILDKIEHRYGVEVTNGEVDFIINFLSGSLKTKKIVSDTIVDIKHRQISETTEALTRKILADVSLLLHPYLLVDPSLYFELSNHIQTLRHSSRIPINFRQDLSDQIKKESPDVFSIALRATKELEAAIGIELPEAETGLLSVLLISALESNISPQQDHAECDHCKRWG